MSKAKHTPGPWTVEVVGSRYDILHEGNSVAQNIFETADANLIACAPEMLEALKSLLEYPGTQRSSTRTWTATEYLEKIIAKATGAKDE